MTVSAIVVTFNSARQIACCLAALREADLRTFVVDNGSSDETLDIVASEFPRTHVIANPENRGFAAAVNQALAEVAGDVVLLVNPDCIVPLQTVRALVAHVERDPTVGLAAPRLVNADGETAISVHPFESLGTVVASRFGGSLLPVSVRRLLAGRRRRRSYDACRLGRAPQDVDWASGACLAVRTSLLRGLGGLDDSYFMYYEDEELCLQAWRAARRVVYLPHVSAQHTGGASSGDPAHVWPHLYRSLLRFQARHRPRTYTAVRVAVIVRAVVGIALGLARDKRRAQAWARIGAIALRSPRRVAARAA